MADTNFTGAYPVDPSTAVGLLRTEVGDLDGTPHDPADDKAEYVYVGDVALQGLITAYPDSPSLVLARALGIVASRMIVQAQDIQVSDIKIKTVERAQMMLDRATALESGAASWDASSAFAVVAMQMAPQRPRWPVQGIPAPAYGLRDRYSEVG